MLKHIYNETIAQAFCQTDCGYSVQKLKEGNLKPSRKEQIHLGLVLRTINLKI